MELNRKINIIWALNFLRGVIRFEIKEYKLQRAYTEAQYITETNERNCYFICESLVPYMFPLCL